MRSSRTHLLVSAALGVALLIATRADADCDVPAATCIDSDILWPHAGPSTFFALASSNTTAKGPSQRRARNARIQRA